MPLALAGSTRTLSSSLLAPREVISSGIDGGMFLKSDPSLLSPDLQFVFNHALLGPPGWDNVTGLGSPDAFRLLFALR